jgi:hypothetical protein
MPSPALGNFPGTERDQSSTHRFGFFTSCRLALRADRRLSLSEIAGPVAAKNGISFERKEILK